MNNMHTNVDLLMGLMLGQSKRNGPESQPHQTLVMKNNIYVTLF